MSGRGTRLHPVVYKVTNKETGLFYIGSTCGPIARRWRMHCYSARRGRGHPLAVAIGEYGPEGFTIEVIEHVPFIADLKDRERFWIEKLKAIGRGYNCMLPR